ncbi:putative ankyrin repeat protein RF_0381 [Cloeon dipterum]|uniref:putative ankyrin repeat protein RF_0381 n=1 Tax=Cloeon dipterum TaxID=197152 RepID=UPI00321F73B0
MNSFTGEKDLDRFIEKIKLGATPLMIAARSEDLKRCLELVEAGQDPEATTDLGLSLFHFAAVNMRHGLEIISHFLGQGLDLSEAKDVDGEDPVLYAIRAGDFSLARNILRLQNGETNLLLFFVTRNNLTMAQLMHAIDPELIKQRDAKGNNALHLAAEFADLEMCEWIVKQGVDVRSVNALKMTALHCAVLNVNYGREIVRYLVFRLKLDVYAKNSLSETPLHLALSAGNLELAQQLLDFGVKVERCGTNLLHYCVKRNKLKSVRFVHSRDNSLVKQLDYSGRNALHIAAESADMAMCHWLIEEGVDAKTLVRVRKTSALHYVGCNKFYGKQLVAFFVGLGLDLNKMDKFLYTPLHVALINQNIEVAEEMIKYEADFRVKSGHFNLLHHCVIENKLKSVKLLFLKDPELAKQLTLSGENALHLAAKHADKEMCLFLCEVADLNPHTLSPEQSNSVLHFAVGNERYGVGLIEYFATETRVDVHQRNRCLETPLHCALDEENLVGADELLRAGADLNVKLAQNSLLHFCATRKKLLSASFVLEKNKDMINELGNYGMTALHVAAIWGHLEFCKFLVEQGIDFNAKDSFDRTAQSYISFENWKLKSFFRSLRAFSSP